MFFDYRFLILFFIYLFILAPSFEGGDDDLEEFFFELEEEDKTFTEGDYDSNPLLPEVFYFLFYKNPEFSDFLGVTDKLSMEQWPIILRKEKFLKISKLKIPRSYRLIYLRKLKVNKSRFRKKIAQSNCLYF